MRLQNVIGGTEALDSLDRACEAANAAVDADLLKLCSDRIAMLLRHGPTLGGLSDERQEEIARWPTSANFTDTERAALTFTEQYIIDVTAISDEQAATLRAHLGDTGLVNFVNAILVAEQRMTLELAFDGLLQ